MNSGRAVFIDRDGVIAGLVADPDSGLPESPLRVSDVSLLPGAAAAMKRLAAAGWLLVGVSNQPAAAKGKITVAELEAVQSRVIEMLAADGARFDDFRLCLHHPHGVVPELTCACACRKPQPGMLRDASSSLGVNLDASWMVGDSDTDVLAGAAAGCSTVLIVHSESSHRRSGSATPQLTAADLESAASLVIERG